MPTLAHFDRNTAGRDWAVGDIHGHFSRLDTVLLGAGFDPAVDRLFSVGDLIDRGPECEQVLAWLAQPWFHAVQGNHEDVAIRYARGNPVDPGTYSQNGGDWFMILPSQAQQCYAEVFAALPYAIEVETANGLVGLVHADCPRAHWQDLAGPLAASRAVRERCMWARDRLNNHDSRGVAGVRAVVVGHTPVREPVVLGNVYHIDTGGWQPGGRFSLLDLDTLRFVPPADQVA